MKKKIVALFLFAAVLILSAPLNASARGKGMMDGSGPYHMTDQDERGMPGDGTWCSRMNLTEEQQTKMTAVRNKYKDQLTKQREKLNEARSKYHNALASDLPAKELEKLHRNLQQEMTAHSDLRFKIMLETRGVLTPEQRQQMGPGMMGGPPKGSRGMGPGKGMGPGIAPVTPETK